MLGGFAISSSCGEQLNGREIVIRATSVSTGCGAVAGIWPDRRSWFRKALGRGTANWQLVEGCACLGRRIFLPDEIYPGGLLWREEQRAGAAPFNRLGYIY